MVSHFWGISSTEYQQILDSLALPSSNQRRIFFPSPSLQGREAPLPLGVLQEIAEAVIPRPAGLMVHDLANAPKACGDPRDVETSCHWIGWWVFTIKLVGLSCKCSHHPILWTLRNSIRYRRDRLYTVLPSVAFGSFGPSTDSESSMKNWKQK